MFVAMLGGLQAFGALGIILGPVLFATAAAILDVLRDARSLVAASTDEPSAPAMATNQRSPASRIN
jgi:predicted PurR-regulated permease PerM